MILKYGCWSMSLSNSVFCVQAATIPQWHRQTFLTVTSPISALSCVTSIASPVNLLSEVYKYYATKFDRMHVNVHKTKYGYLTMHNVNGVQNIKIVYKDCFIIND